MSPPTAGAPNVHTDPRILHRLPVWGGHRAQIICSECAIEVQPGGLIETQIGGVARFDL